MMAVAALLTSCEDGTWLAGDGGEAAADIDDAAVDMEDGVDLAEALDAGETTDDALAETDGLDGLDDGVPDGATVCPIWAGPTSTGGREDGSATHPYAGLQRALDERGSCTTILLRGGTVDRPFDAGVDILLAEGELLTVAGNPADRTRAELDCQGDIGLFATGGGTLVLRHLAVRNGSAATGGCLNAQVGTLWLDDTEWSECRAEEEGGAVWAWSEEIVVSRSAFYRNVAASGGAAWLDGPRSLARVSIEASRFEDNTTSWWAGALFLRAETDDAVVRDSVFRRNSADGQGSAVCGHVGEIRHNRFEENGGSGDAMAEAAAVEAWNTSETRILQNLFLANWTPRGSPALLVAYGSVRNNLFVGNRSGYPRYVGGSSAAVTVEAGEVRNNTFVDNTSTEAAAHLYADDPLGTCTSNLFVGGSGSSAVGTHRPGSIASPPMAFNGWWSAPDPVWGDGVVVEEGNREADPLFDDLAGDFRPGPGSACIDAGDPNPGLVDADGSRNDMGAYGGPDGVWTPLAEGEAP